MKDGKDVTVMQELVSNILSQLDYNRVITSGLKRHFKPSRSKYIVLYHSRRAAKFDNKVH